MREEFWNRRADILRPYDGAGFSALDVARRVGLSPLTVRTYAKRFGFDFSGRAETSATRVLRDALAQLAAAGVTRHDAARKLNVSYQTVIRLSARHGIEFTHALANPDRAEAMASMYRGGKTLEEIGQIYGVTRERVRQIIKKYHGMTATDGGQHVLALRKKEQQRAKAEANCFAKHGCSIAQYRSLQSFARKMVADGVHPERTPIMAYIRQRSNAKRRGIEWRLTLWQWWTLWQDSGKWEQRGRGRGYVMCRFGDVGPYEIGNVYIATAIHNVKVQPNNPYRCDHPDFEKVMALKKKRQGRMARRCEIDGCDGKHYAHGLCQKHYHRLHYKRQRAGLSDQREAA